MPSKLGTAFALRAVALASLVFATLACQQRHGAQPAGAGAAPPRGYESSAPAAPSESEKTRIMQDKAADIERRLAEIQEQRQAGTITEDEAMQAIVQLDAERRAVMAMGEGGNPPQ